MPHPLPRRASWVSLGGFLLCISVAVLACTAGGPTGSGGGTTSTGALPTTTSSYCIGPPVPLQAARVALDLYNGTTAEVFLRFQPWCRGPFALYQVQGDGEELAVEVYDPIDLPKCSSCGECVCEKCNCVKFNLSCSPYEGSPLASGDTRSLGFRYLYQWIAAPCLGYLGGAGLAPFDPPPGNYRLKLPIYATSLDAKRGSPTARVVTRDFVLPHPTGTMELVID